MGLWVRGPPLIRGIMLHHNEMRVRSLILQKFLTSLVWSETQRVRLAHQNLARNIKPRLQRFSPSYQQHFFSALCQFTSFLSAADLALHVFQSARSFKWPDLLLAGWIILSPAWRLSKSRENGLRNIDSYRHLGKELTCDWTCTSSGWSWEERGCLWWQKSSWLNWTESFAGLWAPVRWWIWFWNYSSSY